VVVTLPAGDRRVGGFGSLIIDSTEAQKHCNEPGDVAFSNAVSPDIDIVEQASGMRGAPYSHLGLRMPREVGR
jgi:hypothetical protein